MKTLVRWFCLMLSHLGGCRQGNHMLVPAICRQTCAEHLVCRVCGKQFVLK